MEREIIVIKVGVEIKRYFLTVAFIATDNYKCWNIGTSPSMGFAFWDVILLLEDL